jgi:hypothetical protein
MTAQLATQVLEAGALAVESAARVLAHGGLASGSLAPHGGQATTGLALCCEFDCWRKQRENAKRCEGPPCQ